MNAPHPGRLRGLGLAGSLALHALLLGALHGPPPAPRPAPAVPMQLILAAPEPAAPAPPPPLTEPLPQPPQPLPTPVAAPAPPPAADSAPAPDPSPSATPPDAPPPPRPPARREAPPPPSAEDWALAARYTLKNSKAYRHSWGQQVRSGMGTAVEGPDQGMVRFRVEIAPDGRLVRLDTLWSTSEVAERLARQAIQALPPGPPTPTGQALVFERTIHFSPFATDDPPLYRDDCLPDPPAFRNPYAWDGGGSPPRAAAGAPPSPPDPQALADCLRQLPRDSLEAEAAHDRRLQEQWQGGGGTGGPGAAIEQRGSQASP